LIGILLNFSELNLIDSVRNVHDKIIGSVIETQGRMHSHEMITVENFSTPKLQILYKMLMDIFAYVGREYETA
jgi:hypothetical protein